MVTPCVSLLPPYAAVTVKVLSEVTDSVVRWPLLSMEAYEEFSDHVVLLVTFFVEPSL